MTYFERKPYGLGKVESHRINQSRLYFTYPGGLFYLLSVTIILERIQNYIHYKMWDAITYPFPHFNGAANAFFTMNK